MSVYDCHDPEQRSAGLDEAVNALGRGALVVLPTDTVYGIGADAFDARAVAALLAAKGRGRQMPPPVLVGNLGALDGLATEVPEVVRDLVREFWPGPLTVICLAQPSLAWDLGDTDGTVALRMPADETALALLRRTGPLAVTSANLTGAPAAETAQEAVEYFGDGVAVYLDAGRAGGGTASTIVDATAERLTVLREGALTRAALARVAPELADDATGDGSAGDGVADHGSAGDGVADHESVGGGTADDQPDGAARDEPADGTAGGGRQPAAGPARTTEPG